MVVVCPKCSVNINRNQISLKCKNCEKWFHARWFHAREKCSGLNSVQQERVFRGRNSRTESVWTCEACAAHLTSKDRMGSMEEVNANIKSLMEQMKKMHDSQEEILNSNKELVKSLEVKFNDLAEAVKGVKSDITSLQVKTRLTEEESSKLKEEVAKLKGKIEEAEQHSRLNNIKISGVPYTREEQLSDVVLKIAEVLKVPFTRDCIDTVHRVASFNNKGYKPIILRLTSRDTKEELLRAVRNRKGLEARDLGFQGISLNVYLNEHLTPFRELLYRKAREAEELKKRVFIRRGNILAKTEADSRELVNIRSEEELRDLVARIKSGSVMNTTRRAGSDNGEGE